jgi:hypothetical protein
MEQDVGVNEETLRKNKREREREMSWMYLEGLLLYDANVCSCEMLRVMLCKLTLEKNMVLEVMMVFLVALVIVRNITLCFIASKIFSQSTSINYKGLG